MKLPREARPASRAVRHGCQCAKEKMRSVTTIAKIGMACAILSAIPVSAQKSDHSQTPPRASIAQVTDERAADRDQSAGCTVDLTFAGDGVEHALCARNLRLDEAVDESGRDLRTDQPQEAGGGIFSLRDKPRRPLVLEILLKNPPRKSATIKELKGEVQLFNPTDANGGLVSLPDFSSPLEKPVENPILQLHRIRLLNLPSKDFKTANKYQRKELLEAARQAGLTDDELRVLRRDIQEVHKFSDHPPDPAKTLVIYRHDPENMIVQAEVQDEHGNRVTPNEITTCDNLSLLCFEDDLPKNINLVLRLAVPGAIENCLFDFHDIPLP